MKIEGTRKKKWNEFLYSRFDKTRLFKFSFCDVCRRQMFRGKACLHCK